MNIHSYQDQGETESHQEHGTRQGMDSHIGMERTTDSHMGRERLKLQWKFSHLLFNICKSCLSSKTSPSRRVGLSAILTLRLLLKGKQ